MAKLVLDEIQNRLKLISESRTKLKQIGVDEVHELQTAVFINLRINHQAIRGQE